MKLVLRSFIIIVGLCTLYMIGLMLFGDMMTDGG